MTSVGTLAAFGIVCLTVIWLRRTHPDIPRGYRVPLYPVLPALGIISCFALIFTVETRVLMIFLWYSLAMIALYFVYGMHNSELAKGHPVIADDETLLVQSGKPVGVFRTHEWAPRVLIANSNLVPEWGTWDEFRRLEALGLTMYGQMTAGSWIYIGSQGIVQGTFETFAAMAGRFRALKADPAAFEIVKNSFYKIAEEMRVVLAQARRLRGRALEGADTGGADRNPPRRRAQLPPLQTGLEQQQRHRPARPAPLRRPGLPSREGSAPAGA